MRLESESELKKTYWNTLIHSVIMFAGQSLMQLVDMVFCGKLGANAIATVGTSTSLWPRAAGPARTAATPTRSPKCCFCPRPRAAGIVLCFQRLSMAALAFGKLTNPGLVPTRPRTSSSFSSAKSLFRILKGSLLNC